MRQLEVRRLTSAETDREREVPCYGDTSPPFPGMVSAKMILARLGIVKSTLWGYRQLALECVPEYIEETKRLNPRFWVGFSSTPDRPPFSAKQAEVLQEIKFLSDEFDDHRIVRALLKQKYQGE